MSATTGYFLAGSSWLHRRNPLTKLLGLALVLLASFLLPPFVLPVLAVGHPGARSGRPACSDRSPVDADPGASCSRPSSSSTASSSRARPTCSCRSVRSLTREGLTFGLISAGRLLVVVPGRRSLFLFTTLADDLLEALIARGVSHRLSFVVLSAVQLVPRMQDRAGSILEAQQARGLAIEGSFVRAAPGARAAHRPGRARFAHRRPRADVRPRGARLRSTTRPDGLPRSWPTRRSTAGCAG